MISIELASALKTAGLVWHPATGDRFTLMTGAFDGEVFTLSDMVVEAHESRTGTVLGFNGTTEWALDATEATDALWLPREDQLRGPAGCVVPVAGTDRRGLPGDVGAAGRCQPTPTTSSAYWGDEPAEAYGRALLALIRRATGLSPQVALSTLRLGAVHSSPRVHICRRFRLGRRSCQGSAMASDRPAAHRRAAGRRGRRDGSGAAAAVPGLRRARVRGATAATRPCVGRPRQLKLPETASGPGSMAADGLGADPVHRPGAIGHPGRQGARPPGPAGAARTGPRSRGCCGCTGWRCCRTPSGWCPRPAGGRRPASGAAIR